MHLACSSCVGSVLVGLFLSDMRALLTLTASLFPSVSFNSLITTSLSFNFPLATFLSASLACSKVSTFFCSASIASAPPPAANPPAANDTCSSKGSADEARRSLSFWSRVLTRFSAFSARCNRHCNRQCRFVILCLSLSVSHSLASPLRCNRVPRVGDQKIKSW